MSTFRDDFRSPKQEPTSPTPGDFDWAELAKCLGEQEDLSRNEYERLSHALKAILDWLIAGKPQKRITTRVIGERVIGLCWALNPRYFEHHKSLAALARRIGVHRATLSLYASQARLKWGVFRPGKIKPVYCARGRP